MQRVIAGRGMEDSLGVIARLLLIKLLLKGCYGVL